MFEYTGTLRDDGKVALKFRIEETRLAPPPAPEKAAEGEAPAGGASPSAVPLDRRMFTMSTTVAGPSGEPLLAGGAYGEGSGAYTKTLLIITPILLPPAMQMYEWSPPAEVRVNLPVDFDDFDDGDNSLAAATTGTAAAGSRRPRSSPSSKASSAHRRAPSRSMRLRGIDAVYWEDWPTDDRAASRTAIRKAATGRSGCCSSHSLQL